VICPPSREREYAPKQLLASILRKLVDDAATSLGEPCGGPAVITFSRLFSNDASARRPGMPGRPAGFPVERILNEPPRAALA